MTATHREVTVVVCTRDRARRLEALLESLRAQTLDPGRFEVVVVDDGSSDGTAGLLERETARGDLALRVLPGPGAGIAAARNIGWRAAAAPIAAFTDDDCEVTPDWLANGLRACTKWPGSIVQGRTLPMPREVDRRSLFSRTQKVETLGPFFQACNIFYPLPLLERLGGFALEFGQAGEDTDLAWRAIEDGAPVLFAEEALAYHAVEDLGPARHLRLALRWSDAMANVARHPELRRQVLTRGVFWKRSHALLLQAAAGVLVARRFRPAALLAVPYARQAARRCRVAGASPALAPYLVVHDALECYSALRGGARHGVLVI